MSHEWSFPEEARHIRTASVSCSVLTPPEHQQWVEMPEQKLMGLVSSSLSSLSPSTFQSTPWLRSFNALADPYHQIHPLNLIIYHAQLVSLIVFLYVTHPSCRRSASTAIRILSTASFVCQSTSNTILGRLPRRQLRPRGLRLVRMMRALGNPRKITFIGYRVMR